MGVILDTIFEIENRLAWARAKHPDNGGDEAGSIVAILNEATEVRKAYQDETPERVRDEVLDVIACCVRFLQKEYEEKE